jgi:hypothetical protein
VTVYLLLVFLSGVLVGSVSQRLYLAKTVDASIQQRTPEEWRRKYVNDLKVQVNLNEEQVARLEQILDETKQRMRAIREQERPMIHSIQSEQVAKIRSILRPEQVAAYEQFRLEREKKREAEKKRSKG